MVHCLLDDTIKVLNFAKENKKNLKNMYLNGDFETREEDTTITLNNGYRIRIVNNEYITYYNLEKIDKKSYTDIEQVLLYIKSLF